MIKSRIVDGTGSGQGAKVNDQGRLHVIVDPSPPIDQFTPLLPFAQFFRNEAGSNDMRVDGSVNTVEFFIQANNEDDTYIKTITALIADNSATLAQFGSLTRLTNGLRIGLFTQELGEQFLDEPINSNYDFIRLGLGSPAFGGSIDAYRASNVIGTSDGYSPVIDVAETFGLPYGILLRKGTEDRIIITVRDNLTALDAFNVEVFGSRIPRL